ncbi:MAG: DNA cytosine methyltransferase, partial [Planctomycetaceae bacterium]
IPESSVKGSVCQPLFTGTQGLFATPIPRKHRFPTNRESAQPQRNGPHSYWISDHVKRKLAQKVRRAPFKPAIWHENKGGNIGINPFSCALRANASYNYLLVDGERRLTPREMLRLQGFPETFQIIVPDMHARRQAGNSVVVPKIAAVAKALLAALEDGPPASTASRREPDAISLLAV